MRRPDLRRYRATISRRLCRTRRRQIQLSLLGRRELQRCCHPPRTYHHGAGAFRKYPHCYTSSYLALHICVLYECAAGEESVDGGPVAYVDSVDAKGLFDVGEEVQC